MSHIYAPKTIGAYRLQGLPTDEISVIEGSSQRYALWNLFWLSTPEIDNVPGSGPNWWRYYKPQATALSSMIKDVAEDEVLYRKLMLHPDEFASWFQHEDHSIYETYEVKGGEQWVATVLTRAAEATARMIAENPPVVIEGNVIRVNFRRMA